MTNPKQTDLEIMGKYLKAANACYQRLVKQTENKPQKKVLDAVTRRRERAYKNQ